MVALNRTRTVIDDCEEFIGSSNVMGGPIESYLVQHALVILCAEVQQEVYGIVRTRATSLNDHQIESFVSIAATRVLRSVKKDELSGFVGYFGKTVKKKFNDLVDDREVTTYDNAVRNRHDVAHKTGVQVTFSELKLALAAAENILIAVAESIDVES